MRISRLALFAVVGAAPFAVAEDLTITYKVTSDGAAVTATQYYTAGKIRTSDGKMDSIMDMAGGRILSIDNKKKEYSEITLAEIEAMMKDASAKMAEAQQKMDEAMKNMPPAMREKMGKMMGGGAAGMASNMTVTKGGTRTVAGYPCQEWTTSMGDMMKSDTCNTTALQIPFDPGQFRKFQAMVNPAMMSMMKDMAKATEQLQQIQGLPLAETTSVKVFGRGTTTTKEATEVKKGPIPASAFEVPAGYKKVDSPMKKAAAGGR